MKRVAIVGLLVLVGCGSETAGGTTGGGDPHDAAYIDGFDPPPPEPGQKVYVSPVLQAVQPGEDVTLCTYLDQTFTEATDVTGFKVMQSTGGHHVIVYAVPHPRPVGTRECTDSDMLDSRFVAGGGSENDAGKIFEKVPEGLTFRFPAGAQLMIQTHWINTTSTPIPATQAVAYLTEGPVDESRQVLDLFNVVNTNFYISAHQSSTSSTTCTMKSDVGLYTMNGHEHEWGKHVDIELLDGATSTMLWSHDWLTEYQFNPPLDVYGVDKPLLLKAGQSVRVTCTWNNDTAQDISFPREMCVGTGFYFPGHGEIDCTDGNWSEDSTQ